MSAAGDALRAAQAASGAFPPLQAALSLASYIDESVSQFKSNKREIHEIGVYSRQLSEQLKRHKPTDPTRIENFCRVITDIHEYVKQSTKKHTLVQYLNRQAIADRLQSYRNQLREQFELFSVRVWFCLTVNPFITTYRLPPILMSWRPNAPRRRHGGLTRRRRTKNFPKLPCRSRKAIGLPQFAAAYGLSKIQPSTRVMYKELQGIPEVERTREETIVLQESLQLSEVLFKSDYRWFSSTFKTGLTESDVKGILVELISDIVTDLNDAKLLAGTTRIQLLHQEDDLKRVTILFRALNMRSRDAVFIRSFQRAVHRHQSKVSQHVLNNRLKFEEIMEEEDDE
ncbi:hypothetical protein MSAN_00849400 [Mycena sanguinolenta]|uniref:Uncharacterized protein n=1 Tax=Mycena sanguinolenta TaxID=230812 RepID=A0A8H6YZZ6_9AGAR|nr:hypothetical protein MSAN_00849400 [Mycena sanguinolenta]